MPRNQSTSKTTATGAPGARVAKPGKPRVTASTHSKAVAAEDATMMVKESAYEEEVKEIIASLTETVDFTEGDAKDAIDTISKLAYGYWEKRNGAGGDALSDWVRAEEEYRRRLASA